jgi:hypothetical protein
MIGGCFLGGSLGEVDVETVAWAASETISVCVDTRVAGSVLGGLSSRGVVASP